ncbi:hypothetical protein FNL56_19125 [Tardiphaga sp. vice304]|nr:hypothetical protein FNL53_18885 [Tardiphaga sp. vice278]QDM22840.1 hypothetical protein FIU28_18030 [Tardiphaga sp. vice154]QDM28000.1 hypothetical protein FNL56_19125 [Tardiphaga sp. vice304]
MPSPTPWSGSSRSDESFAARALSPLPAGERSTGEAGRVRGLGAIDRPVSPHPSPLPNGERGRNAGVLSQDQNGK